MIRLQRPVIMKPLDAMLKSRAAEAASRFTTSESWPRPWRAQLMPRCPTSFEI